MQLTTENIFNRKYLHVGSGQYIVGTRTYTVKFDSQLRLKRLKIGDNKEVFSLATRISDNHLQIKHSTRGYVTVQTVHL